MYSAMLVPATLQLHTGVTNILRVPKERGYWIINLVKCGVFKVTCIWYSRVPWKHHEPMPTPEESSRLLFFFFKLCGVIHCIKSIIKHFILLCFLVLIKFKWSENGFFALTKYITVSKVFPVKKNEVYSTWMLIYFLLVRFLYLYK